MFLVTEAKYEPLAKIQLSIVYKLGAELFEIIDYYATFILSLDRTQDEKLDLTGQTR